MSETLRLNDDEMAVLKTMTIEKKQKEWICARLTIKVLLQSKGLSYHGTFNNEYGKPILSKVTGEVSLSHSYPYVAAIYDVQDDVGIDLEHPKPKLAVISKKFMSPSELKAAGTNLTKLCIYWSAKEVLYKIYSHRGLIFKENLRIEPFELQQQGRITGSIIVNKEEKKYNLHYCVNQEYVLVYNV